jgi:hypothetical protein
MLKSEIKRIQHQNMQSLVGILVSAVYLCQSGNALLIINLYPANVEYMVSC